MTGVELLTATEVAERMGVTRATVYRWIRLGHLQSVRTPGVGHRIPADVLPTAVYEEPREV